MGSESRAVRQSVEHPHAEPGSFASSPAYKFAFDQGTEALNRSMASKGLANSGTRLAELTKYGQGLAGQQYFNQANLLSKLAGVDASSPSAAAGPLRPFPTSKTTRLSGPNCGNPGVRRTSSKPWEWQSSATS